MKCDYCGKNEASSRFVLNYMGNASEVHLCEDCLNGFRQYAFGMSGLGTSPMASGNLAGSVPWEAFSQSQEPTRVMVQEAERDFPADVGEELRARRRLTELRARLQSAIESEDYETAARFRDELFRIEKEREPHAT